MNTGRVEHIVHIALQGCLKTGATDYGITPDTGGHIRYLLELARQLERIGYDQTIVTRKFASQRLGTAYSRADESISESIGLHRIAGASERYLPKELLYTEHDAMIANLITWFESLQNRPQLIHAHYSDAGILAKALKREFGIPYLFTPHSLGAVKADMLKRQGQDIAHLAQRIRDEQEVMQAADAVAVSSDDEATRQLDLYDIGQTRILINSPGCQLERFHPSRTTKDLAPARYLIDPLLREPRKPFLLALARPVWRKNLHGLVKAYANCHKLQQQANLVIFAGCRDIGTGLDDEAHAVLNRLFQLIRDHDLEGKVALPASHTAEQVPAMYRYARWRRGLFVNIAGNEPFGLTVLEAAASGLPTIATSRGGCSDTLHRCGHGETVDPEDLIGFANSACRILDNPTLWNRYASAGPRGVRHFSWSRHAEQYVDDLRHLSAPLPLSQRVCEIRPSATRYYLVSDMDGTLLGSGYEELSALSGWLSQRSDIGFVVATGRRPSVALTMLKKAGCLLPEAIIGSMGSIIAPVEAGELANHDTDWVSHNACRWDRAACAEALTDVAGLWLQSVSEQNALKLSYQANDGVEAVRSIKRRLGSHRLDATVVLSHERLIDVLPAGGGKAAAAIHYCTKRGIAPSRMIAAGDSGNDLDMLARLGRGIIVSNHTGELESLRDLEHVHFATLAGPAGVLQGLRSFVEPSDPPVVSHSCRPDAQHDEILARAV